MAHFGKFTLMIKTCAKSESQGCQPVRSDMRQAKSTCLAGGYKATAACLRSCYTPLWISMFSLQPRLPSGFGSSLDNGQRMRCWMTIAYLLCS